MKKTKGAQGIAGLSESKKFFRSCARNYISLYFKPLAWDEDVTSRPDLFLTNGVVVLRYLRSGRGFTKKFFFVECFDAPIYPIHLIRVSGYEDFLERCKSDWRFEFIRRTTDICPEHFDLARNNYGVRIPIGYNFIKYAKECGGETHFTTEAIKQSAIMAAAEAKEMKKLREAKKRLEEESK